MSTTEDSDSSSVTGPLEDVLSEKYQGEVSSEALDAISLAIDTTKNTILDSEENSNGRKVLVKRLIELRIRYEDVRERLTNKPEKVFETMGHTFVDLNDPLTNYSNFLPYWKEGMNKVNCQVCGTSIRINLQYSQHCRDCGFYAHHACLPNTKRECVAIKIRTKPDFIMRICPEKSLPSLNYRCSECQTNLLPSSPNGKPRLCDYTGLHYCSSCHWDASGVTPARIIRNWDFSKVPLCQASKQYLALMLKKPVINVEKANPKLFAVVHELIEVKILRRNIVLMKKYLEVCRVASQEKLLLILTDRQHFVESVDMYSIQDLIDADSGKLYEYLEKIQGIFEEHIKNCDLCHNRGFICELCNEEQDIIFPFSQEAYTCDTCSAVVHRHCFRAHSSVCPKCERIKERKKKS